MALDNAFVAIPDSIISKIESVNDIKLIHNKFAISCTSSSFDFDLGILTRINEDQPMAVKKPIICAINSQEEIAPRISLLNSV